jgi:hypothetical protein
MGDLLITGCYRSGTTITEKLLHGRPEIALASQPFPALYHVTKQRFLDQRSLTRRYPLDHLFLEDDYSREDFARFLEQYRLDQRDLDEVFEQLVRYGEGHWTPQIHAYRSRFRPGTFVSQLLELRGCIEELLQKPQAVYVGSKEILCEEYIPFLLSRGCRVVLVLRDPRDVVTSVNFGERYVQMGAHRPILYTLRAWRKSVAFALAYENTTGFQWVRYEDVVTRPRATVGNLLRGLGVDPPESFSVEIRDQSGEPWTGNSSFSDFSGVTTESVGRFRERLPDDVVRYVETVCLPEMRAVGYSLQYDGDFDASVLETYRPPFTEMHAKFPVDYSYSSEHVQQERHRQARLRGEEKHSAAEDRRWFICDGVSRRLAEALRPNEH